MRAILIIKIAPYGRLGVVTRADTNCESTHVGYSLFALRRPRSPLRTNGERGLLRVNRLCDVWGLQQVKSWLGVKNRLQRRDVESLQPVGIVNLTRRVRSEAA